MTHNIQTQMGRFFLIGLYQTLIFWRVITNLLVSYLYIFFLLSNYFSGLEFLIKEHQNLLYFFELRPKVIVDHNERKDIAQIDHDNASIEQVNQISDITQHP